MRRIVAPKLRAELLTFARGREPGPGARDPDMRASAAGPIGAPRGRAS